MLWLWTEATKFNQLPNDPVSTWELQLLICLGELGCCKNKGDCEGGGYGSSEFKTKSGFLGFTKGTAPDVSRTTAAGALKIGAGCCGVKDATRWGDWCWDWEGAEAAATKFNGKFGAGAGDPILIRFGSGCKIIESSKLTEDPVELDPTDEFEQLLRKFDGGMGTLKGSVK